MTRHETCSKHNTSVLLTSADSWNQLTCRLVVCSLVIVSQTCLIFFFLSVYISVCVSESCCSFAQRSTRRGGINRHCKLKWGIMQQSWRACRILPRVAHILVWKIRERERETAEQRSQKTQMGLIYLDVVLAVQVTGCSGPKLSWLLGNVSHAIKHNKEAVWR